MQKQIGKTRPPFFLVLFIFLLMLFSGTAEALGGEWTPTTVGAGNFFADISYGNNCFLAVDYNQGNIYRSTDDGETWSLVNTLSHNIGYLAYGNGRFIATDNTNEYIYYSDDNGLSWTPVMVYGSTRGMTGIVYGSQGFVATSTNGSTAAIYYSADGTLWTQSFEGIDPNGVSGLALANVGYGNGTYVVVGSNGTIYTSPDAIHWTLRPTPNSDYYMATAYGNNLFVSVGMYGAIITSSDNGVTWGGPVYTASFGLNDVIYENGCFYVVGTGGGIIKSSNGINWSIETSNTTFDLYGIGYVNTKFVVVGDGSVIIIRKANTAPTASNVQISGNLQVGQTLTGSYTYNDADGDPNTSTLKWYRSDDAIGTNKLQISSANNTYTLVSADLGKYISFEVTPTSSSGTTPGTSVESARIGPVTKAVQAAVTYNDVTKTYGDASFTHTASGGSGTGAFSYSSNDTSVATIDSATGCVTILKAGTTVLTATKAGDTVYDAASDTCTLTINKADISGVSFNNATTTYDGTAKIIELTGALPDGASVSYSGNTGTNAGTYNATATITGGTNYNNRILNATLTINKAVLTASVGNYSKTYGEENPAFAVDVTGFINGETAATAPGYTAPAASTTATATTGAGTTCITITGGVALNYTFNVSDTGTLTISKKALTATAAADDKTYNGTTAASGNLNLAGIVGTDDVTASGTFTFTDANAGTGITVNVTGITLGGTKAGNYTVNESTTATAAINKAEISGVSFDNTTVTYDGTAKIILLIGILPDGASVNYSGNTGTNAGTYNAAATITGGTNYNNKTLNATLTINKADISGVSFNNATATYDGMAKTILIIDILPDGATVSYSGNTGTNAGTYNATATITGGTNYNNTTLNATLTINKADISGVSFNNATVTYDGTAKIIELTGALPDGASVSYGGNTGTNAGTYNATATITGGNNYNNRTLNATLTINKTALTATVGDYSKTYGEENPAFAVDVTGFINGETASTASGYTAPTASTTATAATNAGTADITISGGTAANYTFNISDTGMLTINKKALTATAVADDKTYNGTTAAAGNVNLAGIMGTDEVTASGTFTFTDANAGTGKTVNVTGITLGGTKAGNYTVNENTTATAAINKADISGISFNNVTVTYDGTAKLIELTGTLPEGASVSYSSNNGTNAGTYNATATITGGTNYNNATLNAILTINKADISGVSFNNASETYDGTAKTILLTGALPVGASVTYSGNTGIDAGTYNAAATITGGTNYNNTTLNSILTINKADISGVSFNNATVTYDGTAKEILLSGALPDGASVSYSGNTGTNAGTYNVTATITGGTNYNNRTLNATLTINKAALTATVGDYSKTYGEDNPAFTVDVTNFVNGETAATAPGYTAPTASTTATATTGAGTVDITIIGGLALNYTFNVSDTGTLTINKKALTATAAADDKTYDGTTTAAGNVNLTGIVGTDDVMASGTFTFADAGAGIGKTVNVTGITLGGTKAENYSISNTTASDNADIATKLLTATATVNDKVYDGNTTATGTITLIGVIGADVNDVTASGIFSFVDAAVGAGKTVNVTGITLGGAKAGNYSLYDTSTTATAQITKQVQSIAVTILPTKITYVYGEALDPAGSVVTVTYNDSSTSMTSLMTDMCSVAEAPSIGERIVTVTYFGKTAVFNVTYNKAAQTLPAAPECIVTKEGITVTSPVGVGYEYSKDGGASWQTSVTFTGLNHATQYIIAARLIETATHNTSEASQGTAVTFMDTTSPSLTAISVVRTSEAGATVKFTSSEAGQYYYEVVAAEAAKPAINTSGLGVDCEADKETTINPPLTSGAKDIYIRVKDLAGNVSDALKISIPAYIKTDSEKANIDLDALTWTSIKGENTFQDNVTENLNLTVTGQVYGSNISWTSSDPVVVSITGIVTRPAYEQGDANLTLTASVYNSVYNNGIGNTKEFNIKVLKQAARTDANLSGLSITGVLMEPAFSREVTGYSGSVSHGTTSIIITPVTVDASATVKVNGNALTGSAAVSLGTGYNAITIEVTAQDGTTKKTYTVNIYRSNSDNNNSTTTPTTPTGTTNPAGSGVDIIINGRVETAATATTITVEDKTVTTVTVDAQKVEEKLENEGNNTVVTIPVNNNSDVVVGQLNGQTVKNMEAKEALLEIKTENVTYTLPAAQINIDNVSEQIGEQVELKDIVVDVKVAAPPQGTVKIVEDTANKNNYQVVVKPVEFDITCSNGNKTVEISKFNGYVERMVAIPGGIDPSKITTGIVLNNDGTFSHVPTSIIVVNGKYYAKINSLTNSIYSVIWNPKTFEDVENHWAKDAVNDMGSRLVISGVGEDSFEPDRDITRAEFAAIAVRALGLMHPGTGEDAFNDVTKDAWYYDAVSIAYQYGIISGYGNVIFGPEDKITREQAMTMIARAMSITGLKAEFTNGEAEQLLAGFEDTGAAEDYAKSSIAACIKTGVVSGRENNLVAPKDNITRAEVAVVVRRLLQKSKLI